ncbi:MAG: Crp/Fnr family transcriptional regulator [Burkholderiales bacterium]|nr:Crp/Fnr family transcriptional regulator [Burkholderiales bacterium]
MKPSALAALHKDTFAPGVAAVSPPVRIAGLFGHNPHQNHILAALPYVEYERLSPHLELAFMPMDGIFSDGLGGGYAYFPTSSVVSLLRDTAEGATVETAVVGSEGLVGLGHCMGGGENLSRAVVKCAGFGFRLRASVLKEEFDQGGALQEYLLRFVQALLTQTAQSAVCYRHHSVFQQLCRWLLQCIDRQPVNELNMTQELIANMLGVRRESVAEAAGRLQELGWISYSRGRITVADRDGLEQEVCECYENVRRQYAGLLPTPVEIAGTNVSSPSP